MAVIVKTDKTKLIINYVPIEMTKKRFAELFEAIGIITECSLLQKTFFNLCDNSPRGYSKYGFVKFKEEQDAARAITLLHGLRVYNKILKVSYARVRCPEITDANLYVDDIPPSLTKNALMSLFSIFGEIICFKAVQYRKSYLTPYFQNENLYSIKRVYLRYNTTYEAAKAAAYLNGYRTCTVKFTDLPKSENVLIVNNVPPDWTELTLYHSFEIFGPILYCFLKSDISPIQTGYINFKNFQDALDALNVLNDTIHCNVYKLNIVFDCNNIASTAYYYN